LCIDCIRRARVYYQKGDKPTPEYHLVKTVLKRFRADWGHLYAAEFGPLKFKSFRQSLIDSGRSRVTVNHYMRQLGRGKRETSGLSLAGPESRAAPAEKPQRG